MNQLIIFAAVFSIVMLIVINIVIGIYIHTFKKISKRTSSFDNMQHQNKLLNAVNHIAMTLLQTKDEINLENSILMSMECLGLTIDVDRVHIWQNDFSDGSFHFVHKYEWLSESSGQNAIPIGLHFPYNTNSEWGINFLRGECINSLSSNLSQNNRIFLSPFNIKSVVIVPVFLQSRFWGLFSLDDCRKERIFLEEEIEILRSSGLLIADAFLRRDMMQNIRSGAVQLRTALKAAHDANAVKSRFLANMSHEIRTPMNSIIGFSELAQDDDISQKTKDYLSKINGSAQWLLQIINDILDISKIESGKIIFEQIPFDLHSIFEHCHSLIMPRVMEKGLTLHCYADPSIKKNLIGDPVKLSQIFVNLLSNAVKFTNTGTIDFSASIKYSSNDSVTVHFEVKDSGIGINSEQMAKIFEPFVQADNSITRIYGGTGLGLSITKSFIEMMGSVLEVESTPGAGSKFSFDLTFAAINDDDTANIDHQDISIDENEKPNFEAEVLICEDYLMNQQVIREHLAKVGINAVIASNGREGVDMVIKKMQEGHKPFDLIFMDVHMPVMDGLEAASKIIEAGSKTPIVGMTANIMSSELEIYKKNGILGFLGKPFTSQELWKCLMKYLPVTSLSTIDKRSQTDYNEMFQNYFKIYFVKNNKDRYAEFKKAIDEKDIKLAFRLAHNLKGNAGQIGEMRLQEAAAAVESMLKEGKNLLTEEQCDTLEAELKLVLEKLELMLMNSSIKSLDLLDDTRLAQWTEELVQQIYN